MTLPVNVGALAVGDRLDAAFVVDPAIFTDSEDYSWQVRATVLQASHELVFVSGCDSELWHEPLNETPPRLDLPWLRPPFELTIEVRVRENGETRQFGGSLQVAGAGSWDIALSARATLRGPPFEPRPIRNVPEYVQPSSRREVAVPGIGCVRYDGNFWASGGNRLVVDSPGSAPRELVVPGEPNASFETLRAASTGWVVLQRRSKQDVRSFTAFRPEWLPDAIDVPVSITHADFDLDGKLFWFTVGNDLKILELATGEIHPVAREHLVRHFVGSHGAISVAGDLVCGFVGDTLEIYNWRRGVVVEQHKVPTFRIKPLFHPAARRLMWLLRCAQRDGDLSVLRWQDLDGDGVGDVLIEDGLQYAVPQVDGTCIATGAESWLVSPDQGQCFLRTS